MAARSVEMSIDVPDAVASGQPCRQAVTVTLPDPAQLGDCPIVCFALPGGGYGRRYFSADLPGTSDGAQASWHANRGWVFVSVDHLGVGDSDHPSPEHLTFETVAGGDVAVVNEVMRRLSDGTLDPEFPALPSMTCLGIGQSMGGCFLVVAQGQHHVFDGIGVLGFSARHTSVPARPGSTPMAMPWIPRSVGPEASIVLNPVDLAAPPAVEPGAGPPEHPFLWAFHFDDEDPDVVTEDIHAGVDGRPYPPWRSPTIPPCALYMVTPGAVAPEAAAVRVPVFVGMGERDVVPDPRLEPLAYASSPDITVYVCEHMAHMHNFASTRTRLWGRLHSWGTGVADQVAREQ